MARDATHFEYDGFAEIDEKLKNLTLDDPLLLEKIRKSVWEVLGAVRNSAISAGNSAFKDSKHNSIRSIRRSVFRKIIGGAVGFASRRGNSSKRESSASSRTSRIESYDGADRGFILRFVNSGTRERYANGRNSRMTDADLSERRGQVGYRGAIPGYNFFSAANNSIQTAAEKLAQLIDEEINKQFNNG